MEEHDPAEIQTEPASLEQLDVLVAELADLEREEREAREALRLAEVAWRKRKIKADEKRQQRNQVMKRLRPLGVTVVGERAGLTHQQASRILAKGQ
jgi:hypothetical protein